MSIIYRYESRLSMVGMCDGCDICDSAIGLWECVIYVS